MFLWSLNSTANETTIELLWLQADYIQVSLGGGGLCDSAANLAAGKNIFLARCFALTVEMGDIFVEKLTSNNLIFLMLLGKIWRLV